MISVIIPFYNRADYLPQMARCLRQQKGAEFEVIVVDDHSEDSQFAALQKTGKQEGWRIFRNEVNSGPGPTRNNGIKHARGNYILFMDSDDELHPRALMLLEQVIAKRHPQIIAFDVQMISPRVTKRYRILPKSKTGKVEADYAFAMMNGSTWGKCYRRDFIDANKVSFTNYMRHEDTAFTKSALARAKDVYYLPVVLYRYKVNANSLVLDVSSSSLESSFAALEQVAKHRNKADDMEQRYVYTVEVVLSCAMRIIEQRMNLEQVRQLLDRFDKEMPNWWDNPYLKKSSLRYRLIAFFVRHRFIKGLYLMMVGDRLTRVLLKIG